MLTWLSFFAHLGSGCVKAVRGMLMKLSPGLNFTNIAFLIAAVVLEIGFASPTIPHPLVETDEKCLQKAESCFAECSLHNSDKQHSAWYAGYTKLLTIKAFTYLRWGFVIFRQRSHSNNTWHFFLAYFRPPPPYGIWWYWQDLPPPAWRGIFIFLKYWENNSLKWIIMENYNYSMKGKKFVTWHFGWPFPALCVIWWRCRGPSLPLAGPFRGWCIIWMAPKRIMHKSL